MIRLYGTLTSPYVRRVRVVALELGLSVELVDAASDEGQAAMRAINPLWKVPTVELDGQAIFDSRVINEELIARHGPGPLAPHEPDDLDARNLVTVIDGALDALVNTVYLAKDGVAADAASYIAKQHARAADAMAWVDARIDGLSLTRAAGFGLAELALCTAVEWMRFRQTYPIERHAAIVRVAEHHAARPSLVATRPPVSA
ncbi:putative GST-like protein YibF [Enhygromyxa salina]|uniref:Putative GST-like protein YibF n=1 Tax=Enhygromyxa salina TaxID=215803 RepID=A0A2S9YJN7_9BACT|nr:glutathione S-transferase N-terminal domain-containing protein [Enhygromyxa salina]PRQ05291.1 putative GST-like protein YibF [Enhygromyxa salina]